MKLVVRRNFVVFMRFTPSGLKKMYSFKSLIVYFHTWFFYGIREIEILNVNNQPYPMLAESFHRKLNAPVYRYKHVYDNDLARKYNPLSERLLAGKSVLLLDDDCWSNERTGGDSVRVLEKMKEHISRVMGSDKVLYKRHPSPQFHSKTMGSIYGEYAECPSYVPADFVICNPQIRYVIGGASVVLSAAARHTDALAISYLKLVPFKNEAYKQFLIDYLKDVASDRILFLDTIDDFYSLVKARVN